MKNIFDYATKELSQDAFLRWLFENHDDAEIGEVANRLLSKLCNFQDDERVQSLETEAQRYKIDISVRMTTTLDRNIALFIEDKTFSNEHSQLKVYDNYIDGIKDYDEIHKVFYKTNFIESEEQNRIYEANKDNKVDWEICDIKDIYSFFEEYVYSSNLILSQYASHLKDIYTSVTNTEKPKANNTTTDFLAWQAYYVNTVIPNITRRDRFYYWANKAGQYPYVNLGLKKAVDKNIPYLEVRSRDCCGEQFVARFLCYEMPTEDIPQQKILMEKLKSIFDWDCKHIVKQKRGKKDYYPKQIGVARKECRSSEEFINWVNYFAEQYLKLMEDWK